jgi:small-conductance mechanosensitive channel
VPDLDVTRDHVIETSIALAVFAGGMLIAWLLRTVLRRLVHLLTRSSEQQSDERLSHALRAPLGLLVVVLAGYIALRTLSYLDPHRHNIERVVGAMVLGLLVLIAQRLVSTLVFRNGSRGAAAGYAVPLARRAVNVAIIAIGVLLVLDQLGIAISPLLAGLGISGLAVALALQPLLSNLFAGYYVMSDSSIQDGDWVAVQNGPSGHVIDIGWRATRLRNLDGQMVIVPNATLASSIVTNFGSGRPADVAVVYQIPVDRDLQQVEDIGREVLRSVIQDCDEAAKDYKPLVRFQGLNATHIECLFQVRARSRIEVPQLTHILVKRLHDRLEAAAEASLD